MKRIVMGSLRQETNSFSPVRTTYKDFTVAKGKGMLEKVAATQIFEEAGVEIIPTLCAYALPSGKVDKKCYTEYKDYILKGIPENEKIDGVWLYLHGAMEVEEIGSGEALL
ncbi:MAG: M81 family metallopeptidase, partial [Ruminiclostridium sp.]|nr:M81 family metallopeptidase [Ruminiclostridium sp.]